VGDIVDQASADAEAELHIRRTFLTTRKPNGNFGMPRNWTCSTTALQIAELLKTHFRKEKPMQKLMLSVLALLFALSMPNETRAQTPPSRLPRGTATDVTNTEILATAQKTASAAVSDQALRVVSINDEYNVAVGVVHRAKTASRDAGGGIEHSQITEVYHVIGGNGTLVTGGTMENPKESLPDSLTVKVLNGPSTNGGVIQNGVSRKIGPGDVVVIPPNTPH
jgi:hypothetical protein